ncbi:ABC transporter substrate-binding protein [Spiractinospora alimapuensis]|uniref:ABC transporter substrate-binding protein n=1 Tax=Spiractinospora alimapuensis TaxID=2820884 RepID=UPI001F16D2F9|nr:ABC transporter substrate-binding protein [Spiractinospora alimapuensis]QVQ54307.1 ABC transporter substrate-binding protein [Spiractinospora alimapuensis]
MVPVRSSSPVSRRAFLARSSLAAAAAIAGPGLLSACGSRGGGDATTFLSYLPLETLSMTPELLALAGGHFAEHGLDVELQEVQGSPQAMQTLISGLGPITRIGQIDLMTTVADSDQPLVCVGSLTRGTSQRVVYSTENLSLETPEDFLDQTIGVPSEGGTSDLVVSLVLANAGLDPDQTAKQVVGLTPGTFNLVQQGELAGYVVSIDTAHTVVAQNEDAAVFDPATLVASDSQVYVTTEDDLQDNAEVLEAFMRAIHDALASVVADESLDETLETLRGENSFTALDDDEIARQALTELRDLWSGGDADAPLLVTHDEAWVSGYEELVAAGLASPDGDASAWFDNSLLPGA